MYSWGVVLPCPGVDVTECHQHVAARKPNKVHGPSPDVPAASQLHLPVPQLVMWDLLLSLWPSGTLLKSVYGVGRAFQMIASAYWGAPRPPDWIHVQTSAVRLRLREQMT